MPAAPNTLARSHREILHYLNGAHALTQERVRSLEADIAITPRGTYRSALERRLGETRSATARLERRMAELGASSSLLETGIGALGGVLGGVLTFWLAPFVLLRSFGGDEQLLHRAGDRCAAEAREIAACDTLEHLARGLGDEPTAQLAAELRSGAERMLARLRDEIPKLTDGIVRAELLSRQEG